MCDRNEGNASALALVTSSCDSCLALQTAAVASTSGTDSSPVASSTGAYRLGKADCRLDPVMKPHLILNR